tara:strand:- start:282 stop:560 length:279 start_codon:yes stop_codon:yes gene_type:complete
MFNVIFTYQSVLPESMHEDKTMNLGQFDTVADAREYILDEYDAAVAKLEDDGEGHMCTAWLADHYAKRYTIEEVVVLRGSDHFAKRHSIEAV